MGKHGLPCRFRLVFANGIPDPEVLAAQVINDISAGIFHIHQIMADVFAQHAQNAGVQIGKHAVV